MGFQLPFSSLKLQLLATFYKTLCFNVRLICQSWSTQATVCRLMARSVPQCGNTVPRSHIATPSRCHSYHKTYTPRNSAARLRNCLKVILLHSPDISIVYSILYIKYIQKQSLHYVAVVLGGYLAYKDKQFRYLSMKRKLLEK